MNSEQWLDAGTHFYERGQFAAAFECFTRIDPQWPEARLNSVKCRASLNELTPAEDNARYLVEDYPGNPEAHNTYAWVLERVGKFEEAQIEYERALEANPSNPEYYRNSAHIAEMRGQYGRARAGYEACLSQFPSDHQSRAFLGMLQIAHEEYEEGFQNYEARLALFSPLPYNGKPVWNGENLTGKTLAIYCEQGMGDSIMFVRYAKAMKEFFGAAKVVVFCKDELYRLFRLVDGVDEVIGMNTAFTAYDYHVPMMSLPRILRAKAGLVLGTYFRDNRLQWAGTCPNCNNQDHTGACHRNYSGYREVGICWKGNPAHLLDHFRSATMLDFLPIYSSMPTVSLQFGASRETVGTRMRVIPNGDMLALAEELLELRAVITVDTAVAHLAGALGVPVAILLPPFADCRWSLAGERTHWYPSARLFRAKQFLDWTEALADAKEWVATL